MGKNRSLRYLDPACGNFMRFWQQKAPFCRGKAGYHFANTSLRGQFGKCELVGVKLRHFACAKTFCRSNIPLGCLLLAQTRTCRGAAPPSCWRKTVLSLESPTGAFIASLRFANANLISSSKRLCFNFLLCISLLYLYFRFHIHHVLIWNTHPY